MDTSLTVTSARRKRRNFTSPHSRKRLSEIPSLPRNAGLLLQPYRRFRVFRPLWAQGGEANTEPDSVGVLQSAAGHSYHQKSTANGADLSPRLDGCISQTTSPYGWVGQTKNAKEDIDLDFLQIFGYSKNIIQASRSSAKR